jgi:hypothetical protein
MSGLLILDLPETPTVIILVGVPKEGGQIASFLSSIISYQLQHCVPFLNYQELVSFLKIIKSLFQCSILTTIFLPERSLKVSITSVVQATIWPVIGNHSLHTNLIENIGYMGIPTLYWVSRLTFF